MAIKHIYDYRSEGREKDFSTCPHCMAPLIAHCSLCCKHFVPEGQTDHPRCRDCLKPLHSEDDIRFVCRRCYVFHNKPSKKDPEICEACAGEKQSRPSFLVRRAVLARNMIAETKGYSGLACEACIKAAGYGQEFNDMDASQIAIPAQCHLCLAETACYHTNNFAYLRRLTPQGLRY